MTNDSIITNNGKKMMLYRSYTPTASLSATLYLPATKYKLGVNNGTPNIADTALDLLIPIANGTVNDDGSSQLTGGTAGSNTTDNTTTYKQGAGVTDNTSQDLLKTNTNVLATWTNTNLAAAGVNCDATKYIGLWIYIKDAATLAKFLSSGTALEIRIGADSTANFYYKTYTAANLTTGWNWLSDGAILSTWSSTGTPGTLNDFQIRITTNILTDTFTTGDVLFDLLRQWVASDTIASFVSGYPSLDYINLEASTRMYLSSVLGNGFNINGLATFNEDSTPLMLSEDTFTAESKSTTDEFVFAIKDRIL